jgi:hypothetical protein
MGAITGVTPTLKVFPHQGERNIVCRFTSRQGACTGTWLGLFDAVRPKFLRFSEHACRWVKNLIPEREARSPNGLMDNSKNGALVSTGLSLTLYFILFIYSVVKYRLLEHLVFVRD